ncbi:MAG: deoxyguanosinetriphosphate triphosphohydrolase, partial [Frankiales bacterium]|nr:deoxyguanosinetriphosphate triphosphohydrolase [Frankiales bacterium]
MTPDDVARWAPEPPSARDPYARDRARVLHSGALRRLAGKTQVVEPYGPGVAVPRTRLTHSLETAQIGRELGAELGCDPDLVDAACLAHDLGHPPFGHNGEAALDEVSQPCGGFEGNAQSLRVLTRLEVKVPGAGLNLTRATLDAATKYPWPRVVGVRKYGVYPDDLPVFTWLREGAPEGGRPLETQVMDWADDVAYSVHDLEDGVLSGQVRLEDLRRDGAELAALAARHYSRASAAELEQVLDGLLRGFPPSYDAGTADEARLKALTSSTIGRFCRAAEQATRAAHGDGPLRRYAAGLVVPAREQAECALLKAVTARYVMGRPGVEEVQAQERRLLRELVEALWAAAPGALDRPAQEAWARAEDDA